MADLGIAVAPGAIGENVCVSGVQLLDLPVGAVLRLGDNDDAPLVALTGLRNPCAQLNALSPDLSAALSPPDPTAPGGIGRRAGVFATVLRSGACHVGAKIAYSLPPQPHCRLERV